MDERIKNKQQTAISFTDSYSENEEKNENTTQTEGKKENLNNSIRN